MSCLLFLGRSALLCPHGGSVMYVSYLRSRIHFLGTFRRLSSPFIWDPSLEGRTLKPRVYDFFFLILCPSCLLPTQQQALSSPGTSKRWVRGCSADRLPTLTAYETGQLPYERLRDQRGQAPKRMYETHPVSSISFTFFSSLHLRRNPCR